jgi:FkbM family methyltransferase
MLKATYVQGRRPGDDRIREEVGQGVYSFKYALKPGDRVLDIGAHRGFFASWALDHVGEKGWVTCFEPEPDNYKLLSDWAHEHENVIAYNMALWSEPGKKRLYLSHSCAEHTLIGAANRQYVDVVVSTIDSNVLRADFMKIDVEGAELEVLKGGYALLDRSRPHIAIELASNMVAAVSDYLKQFEYEIYVTDLCGGVYLYATPPPRNEV